jgi:hypothetical protein
MGDTMTEDQYANPAELELALTALVSERYMGRIGGAEVDAKVRQMADRLGAWRAALAKARPCCPECHSAAYTVEQEAWGDRSYCPDCGFDRYVSIGD